MSDRSCQIALSDQISTHDYSLLLLEMEEDEMEAELVEELERLSGGGT